MKISWLGDSALLLDFQDESSSPTELLRRALAAAAAIKGAAIAGVTDVTSAFTAIAVYFDAEQGCDISEETIAELVRADVAHAGEGETRAGNNLAIPVCFDAEFALDLPRAAEQLQMPPEEIIASFCSAEFAVACIGFMPGFPYLAGLPQALRLPRLGEPRTCVPAGSVAIADHQAGIYPFASPGGWNVLGRTPWRLFDPAVDPPSRLQPGDVVRFRPIDREEFNAAR